MLGPKGIFHNLLNLLNTRSPITRLDPHVRRLYSSKFIFTSCTPFSDSWAQRRSIKAFNVIDGSERLLLLWEGTIVPL